jgi:hypothetical protein
MSDEEILLQVTEIMDAYQARIDSIEQRKRPEEPQPKRYYWEGETVSPSDRHFYALELRRYYAARDRGYAAAAGKAFDTLAEALGLGALSGQEAPSGHGEESAMGEKMAGFSLPSIRKILLDTLVEIKDYIGSDENERYKRQIAGKERIERSAVWTQGEWDEWVWEHSEATQVLMIKSEALEKIGELRNPAAALRPVPIYRRFRPTGTAPRAII